jgi:Tetratricopeptide repeat/TPR repeat
VRSDVGTQPADALVREATRHFLEGRLNEAEELYRKALRQEPGNAIATHCLGVLAMQRGDAIGGVELMERAVAARDDIAEFHANLGLCYRRLGRVREAIESHQRAIALDPRNSTRHANLAVALQEEGRVADALDAFDRALQLDPQNAEAHYSRSLAHLVIGDYRRGWAGYEWRARCREFANRDLEPAGMTPWLGEDLEGKTLLVRREQGHGDMIQLLRFVPLLADRGARVRVEVPGELAELARSVDPRVDIVEPGERRPGIDFYVNLLSLPGRLSVTAEAIPNPPPYLTPDPARVRDWRARLAGYPGRKIGLAWGGNPLHHNDRNRSCALRALAPLLEVQGISWFSLQLGSAAEQLAAPGARAIVDLREFLHSYSDTAAAIAALDLVISVDTSVAHLGGAIASPVWVLVPYAPDWRWLRDRTDSPWYPTVRLFRQEVAGDWTAVVEALRSALGRLPQSNSGSYLR